MLKKRFARKSNQGFELINAAIWVFIVSTIAVVVQGVVIESRLSFVGSNQSMEKISNQLHRDHRSQSPIQREAKIIIRKSGKYHDISHRKVFGGEVSSRKTLKQHKVYWDFHSPDIIDPFDFGSYSDKLQ